MLTETQIDQDIRNELYGLSDKTFENLMKKRICKGLRQELMEYAGKKLDVHERQCYNEDLDINTEAMSQQLTDEEREEDNED